MKPEKRKKKIRILELMNFLHFLGKERNRESDDTWSEVWCCGGCEEVEEAGAAVELGEEDGGVGLGVRRFDPMETGSNGAISGATFAEDTTAIAAEAHGECNVFGK